MKNMFKALTSITALTVLLTACTPINDFFNGNNIAISSSVKVTQLKGWEYQPLADAFSDWEVTQSDSTPTSFTANKGDCSVTADFLYPDPSKNGEEELNDSYLKTIESLNTLKTEPTKFYVKTSTKDSGLEFTGLEYSIKAPQAETGYMAFRFLDSANENEPPFGMLLEYTCGTGEKVDAAEWDKLVDAAVLDVKVERK